MIMFGSLIVIAKLSLIINVEIHSVRGTHAVYKTDN